MAGRKIDVVRISLALRVVGWAMLFFPLIASSQYDVHKGFMPNVGQLYDQSGAPNHAVQFAHFTQGLNVLVHEQGFSYDVWASDSAQTRYHRIDFVFDATAAPLHWKAAEQQQGIIHVVDPYWPSTTHSMPHFRSLVASDVFPHIDLELIATSAGMKYNFILHPGAHIDDIALEVRGAPSSIVEGSISIQTIFGRIQERVPRSFCRENGNTVQCAFESRGDHRYGFALSPASAWDASQHTLVIDPVPNRLWGSYWGGTSLEFVYGLTEDNSGNVYVCGVGTGSLSFTTTGAYQTVMAGPANDAFIFKFNASGIVQWCTYYGGNNGETARAISASGAGDLYVVGFTDSTSGIASPGAFRTTLAGGTDSFLVKFSTTGAYVWGTYIGGTSEDYLRAVHYDASSDVVIVGGHTKSATQATTGAHQTAHAGAGDGYLASFSSAGARNWATYYGGSGEDIINGVHLNGTGNILIGGSTASLTGIATSGVHQTASGGAMDGFMAVFSSAGARSWGSYFGGSGTDVIRAVKMAYNGRMVGVGETSSAGAIASPLAHQTALGGGNDAMVAVLQGSGTLAWSTYYGGAANDAANALAIDTTNNVYIIGNTASSAAIATPDGYQTAWAGGLDGFIAQLTQNGLRNWGTYYGGSGSETVNGGVVNLALQLHIAGHSTSTSGITTPGTSQVNHTAGINDDPFIVKFGELVLPIRLGAVAVECSDGQWQIHWETITESYTDYFEVYWANDLSQWQLCDRISAKGHSLEIQDYTVDGACIPFSSGYFQIILVNTDGSRELVYTGALNCEAVDQWSIAPNPTASNFKLLGAIEHSVIYDGLGRLMGQYARALSDGVMEVDTSAWPNGVYMVHAFVGGDWQSARIVVHRD